MYDLTAFQRDILCVIAGAENPSGQDVKDDLDQYYNEDINHSRLYPNIDSIVKMGLVEKGRLDRRANYYTITDIGLQQIEDHWRWRSQVID